MGLNCGMNTKRKRSKPAGHGHQDLILLADLPHELCHFPINAFPSKMDCSSVTVSHNQSSLLWVFYIEDSCPSEELWTGTQLRRRGKDCLVLLGRRGRVFKKNGKRESREGGKNTIIDVKVYSSFSDPKPILKVHKAEHSSAHVIPAFERYRNSKPPWAEQKTWGQFELQNAISRN